MFQEFNQKLQSFESYTVQNIQKEGTISSIKTDTIIRNPARIKTVTYKEGDPESPFSKDSPSIQYAVFENDIFTQYVNVNDEWIKTKPQMGKAINEQLYNSYWNRGAISAEMLETQKPKGEMLGEEVINGIDTYKAKITYDKKYAIQSILRSNSDDIESLIGEIEDPDLKEAIEAIEDPEVYVWFDKENKYVVKTWQDNSLTSRARGLVLLGSHADASKKEKIKTMTKTSETYYTDINNCKVFELPVVE